MIKKIERIYQKGVSLVEAMTAAAVLGLAKPSTAAAVIASTSETPF